MECYFECCALEQKTKKAKQPDRMENIKKKNGRADDREKRKKTALTFTKKMHVNVLSCRSNIKSLKVIH